MTLISSAVLNEEIAQRYGDPEDFRDCVLADLIVFGISKRALAIRAGLCYTHVLKVLNGRVRPRLETMLLLDEAREQLIEDQGDDE